MNSGRIRYITWIVLVVTVSMLTACTGTGGKSALRPEAQLRAVTLLERGLRAQEKGEMQQAEQFFMNALANSSSIEDNPARIIVLINLARLNRLDGNYDKATRHVDQTLHLCTENPFFLAEAAYEKAHIELALNNNNDALLWATRSLDAESGSLKGVRRNLLARIQFVTGNTKGAILSANNARQENQRSGQLAEEANSLRMLGTIELNSGRLDAAGKYIREALGIDKQIGASVKIGLDLEKLADVAEGHGDLNIKADYLERAYSVHLSAGRLEKASLILQKLVNVYRKTGDISRAEGVSLTFEQLKRSEPPYPNSTAESARPSSKP